MRYEVWEKLAHKYNRLWVQKYSLRPTRRDVKTILLPLIKKNPDLKILDIGCGTGQLAKEVSARFPKINYMGMADLEKTRKAMVKIRYAHAGSPCFLEKLQDGRVKCTFDEPVRAATPGQSIVFYEDGYVLGSGTIL